MSHNHTSQKSNNMLIYSPTPVKLNITPPTSPFGLFTRNKADSPMISPFKVPHSFKSPNLRPYKKFGNTEDNEMGDFRGSSPKFANNLQDIFIDIKHFPNFNGNDQEISSFQSPNGKYNSPCSQFPDPGRPSQPQLKKTHYCNCKKTKCLKLYCECFAIGEVCDSNCCCHDCSNTNNSSLRDSTIEQILAKDPEAFNAKIDASANKKVNRRGCTCRKTNCLKKYCECFHAGIPCSEFCKCDHCRNNEFSIKESAFKKLVIATPLKEDENKSEDTIDTSYKKNGMMTLKNKSRNSPETWLSEPRKMRKITIGKNGKQEESNGKIIIEKSLIF